jgi:hypothetical protein
MRTVRQQRSRVKPRKSTLGLTPFRRRRFRARPGPAWTATIPHEPRSGMGSSRPPQQGVLIPTRDIGIIYITEYIREHADEHDLDILADAVANAGTPFETRTTPTSSLHHRRSP